MIKWFKRTFHTILSDFFYFCENHQANHESVGNCYQISIFTIFHKPARNYRWVHFENNRLQKIKVSYHSHTAYLLNLNLVVRKKPVFVWFVASSFQSKWNKIKYKHNSKVLHLNQVASIYFLLSWRAPKN